MYCASFNTFKARIGQLFTPQSTLNREAATRENMVELCRQIWTFKVEIAGLKVQELGVLFSNKRKKVGSCPG